MAVFYFRATFGFGLLMGCVSLLHAQLSSVDSGSGGVSMAQWEDALIREWGASAPWLRIRARPDPSKPENTDAVAAEVAGLAHLRELGFKAIPFYRWSNNSWRAGVRSGPGPRVPLDLREAYQRGIAYGQAYGAAVAGFEIENEPDISFVEENPETYAAFLKAVYLGLKKGSEVGKEEGGGKLLSTSHQSLVDSIRRPATHCSSLVPSFQKLVPSYRPIRPADRGLYAGHRAASLATSRQSLVPSPQPPVPSHSPLVVMAPLALPPGPYFEQLVTNGLFSYTDAFNYHYYGYAEDFSGVYEQFESAVAELSVGREFRFVSSAAREAPASVTLPIHSRARPAVAPSPPLGSVRYPVFGLKKPLPVLLTEYGYGSLDGEARNAVEGRVRQWRWFRNVGEQIRRLRIAGPMAFYLPPYFEREVMEFGLSVPVGHAAPSSKEKALSPANSDSSEIKPTANRLSLTAGDLTYKPADFGVDKVEPWMRHIGRRFGDNEASPALAWLFEEGQKPYRPKDWTVRAALPSPVVIDFVAGDGLVQVKRYGGYLAKQNLVAGSLSLAASNQKPEARNQLLGANHQPPASSPQPLAPSHSSLAPSPQQQRSDSAESLTDEQLQITNDQIPHKAGSGLLVLYNFSDAPITGRIEIATGRDLLAEPTELEGERILAPMCRIAVPLVLQVPAGEFTKHALQLRFVPTAQRNKPVSPTVFVTALYPDATGMSETQLVDFNTVGRGFRTPPNDAKSSEVDATTSAGALDKAGSRIPALQLPTKRNLAFLETRALATEEPRLVPQAGSRWLVTPGVTVSESGDGTWRFRITAYPSEPNRPAMAELVLPDDFVFPDGGMMQFSYRLAELAGSIPEKGAYFEPYFRTANGNLYQVWPRQRAGLFWQRYTEVKENYTMAFYGRANLPWRFRDNRPVSLVFFFRPGALPATYEVKNARIVRLSAGS